MTESPTSPEDMMDCPNCSTPQPDAARFCARCGTPLHPGIDRAQHFAAQPDEPVRALALGLTALALAVSARPITPPGCRH